MFRCSNGADVRVFCTYCTLQGFTVYPDILTHNTLLPSNPGSAVCLTTARHQSEEEVQEEERHFCFLLDDRVQHIPAQRACDCGFLLCRHIHTQTHTHTHTHTNTHTHTHTPPTRPSLLPSSSPSPLFHPLTWPDSYLHSVNGTWSSQLPGITRPEGADSVRQCGPGEAGGRSQRRAGAELGALSHGDGKTVTLPRVWVRTGGRRGACSDCSGRGSQGTWTGFFLCELSVWGPRLTRQRSSDTAPPTVLGCSFSPCPSEHVSRHPRGSQCVNG